MIKIGKLIEADLMTILHFQLCSAQDVANRLGDITDETEPFRISHDLQLIKGNIQHAIDRLEDVQLENLQREGGAK